jgi:hypothetical protein
MVVASFVAAGAAVGTVIFIKDLLYPRRDVLAANLCCGNLLARELFIRQEPSANRMP